jgi:hypothetical protein
MMHGQRNVKFPEEVTLVPKYVGVGNKYEVLFIYVLLYFNYCILLVKRRNVRKCTIRITQITRSIKIMKSFLAKYSNFLIYSIIIKSIHVLPRATFFYEIYFKWWMIRKQRQGVSPIHCNRKKFAFHVLITGCL